MTRDDESQLLISGASAMGLALEAPAVETLLRLVDELEAANAHFNLTAIRDRPGMLRKHVLDSLSLQPYLRGGRLADVGTGAGFPGLPLAIANPTRQFALIEATGKKARFVQQTALRLGCANVEVVHARRNLPTDAALRHGHGAGAGVARGFRGIRRPPVRAGWPLVGDEGQTSGRRGLGRTQVFPRHCRAPAETAGAGR
jgi:hypothetical protein